MRRWIGLLMVLAMALPASAQTSEGWEYVVATRRVVTRFISPYGPRGKLDEETQANLAGIEELEADEATLDALGRQGWELVSVVQLANSRILYYFKRPLGRGS